MIKRTIFECEYCGKQSRNEDGIFEHEAAHLGLSPIDKLEWDRLKEVVRHKSYIVSYCKNEQTEKDFDEAVEKLIAFERIHNIEAKC